MYYIVYRNESDLRMIFMLSSSLRERTSLDAPWLWLLPPLPPPLLFMRAVLRRHRRILCRVLARWAALDMGSPAAVDSVNDVIWLMLPTDQKRRNFGILLQMVMVAVGCSGQ